MKKNEAKKVGDNNYDLRGTFIFVMLLGLFIIGSWFAIYALFLSR